MLNNKHSKYFNFSGINAFVTGASGYLGRTMCEALAEHGAKVYLNGRNAKKINAIHKNFKKRGLKSEPVIIDILDFKSIKNFFFKNKKPFGIIINNAHSGKPSSFENSDLQSYNDAYNISVLAAANLIDSAKKNLILSSKKNSTSSIVNISSMYGSVAPNPKIYGNSKLDNPPYYGAAKAALEQYSKYAAVNLAKHRIRVNTISPGPFPSPTIVKKNKNFIKNLQSKNPLNTIGKPKDLITSILFLCSNSSNFITGINIPVDGGWKIW
jgi:NAD(P)-dependent dehydrogenase (short-subunit alcohol dehydrogenase family)